MSSIYINVKDFGAVGNNFTDNRAAIQDAVNRAADRGNATVFFPPGRYVVSGEIILGQGINLLGDGNVSGTEQYGVTIMHTGTGNLFTWDGSADEYGGAGGGIRNMYIRKSGANSNGGVAINLYATSDSRRPGEMIFDNVLISSGVDDVNWEHCILADGRNANTAGGRGIRSLHFRKCRVSSCSTDNKAVWFRQVTHVFGDIQVDDVGSAGTPGITFDDFWDQIHLDMRVVGNIIVNHSGTVGVDVAQMVVRGTSNNFTNTYASVAGCALMYVGSVISNASNAFIFAGRSIRLSVGNVSATPTDAELTAAVGVTAAVAGPGFFFALNDANAGLAEFLVWSDGTNWFYAAGTKAL